MMPLPMASATSPRLPGVTGRIEAHRPLPSRLRPALSSVAVHRPAEEAYSTLPSERKPIRRPLRGAVGAVLVAALMLPACTAAPPPWVAEDCTRDVPDGQSVARVWDEQVLELIRHVVPAPTVHARNLFHVSAAMWDAWAAY